MGMASLKNIVLLSLMVILYGCPIISLLSMMLPPSSVFYWMVVVTYASYALACSFILIMNLTRVNMLLYNYLASLICALCLTVTWSKGPSVPKSWMPIISASAAGSSEDLSV